MATVIYPSPIFGPIHSRRLGISVGINLMPADGKICTFDCIYCECGFNQDRRPKGKRPSREEVHDALQKQLIHMADSGETPNVLTFAGNGEPTAHPDFLNIVQDTIVLRNLYFPKAKVSVLSNATLIDRPNVYQALMLIDNNILKLDTVNTDYIHAVNRPLLYYSAKDQIESFKKFNGHVVIQTMFMTALLNNEEIDNTTEAYVTPWLKAVEEIKPREVMIYTIDRETPDQSLRKASKEKLDAIVKQIQALRIKATAFY